MTEIAERVGLHKSTVHRFMVNLDAAGLVERNPRSGALPPGAAHLRARRPRDAADEPLGRGAAVPRGPRARHRRDRPSGRARRRRGDLHRAGRGAPAAAGALGDRPRLPGPRDEPRARCCWPTSPRERVVEIVADARPARPTRATRSPISSELEAELERIRARGYAIDDEEYDEGLRCIGAGVRDHSGRVVSAIGIGGPVTRITPERVEELSRPGDDRRRGPLPAAGRRTVRRLHPRRAPGPHHRGRAADVRHERRMSRPPPVGVGRTQLPALPTHPRRQHRHGDHRHQPSAPLEPHIALRPAQAVGVHAQGRGARAGDRQARHPLREGRLPGRGVPPRPAHHGGLRQGRRRRPRALRPGPGPAGAARRDRRGGHQARPPDGARGGAGHDGRQARPDPVAAHDRRPGRRGHLPEPGLPAGRVLDHLRRRQGGLRAARRAGLPLRPRLARRA